MTSKKNDVIRIKVERLNEIGEALAFPDGKKTIIHGLLPDETADVKIVKTGINVDFAIISKIIDSNPQRTENPCKNITCGACDLLFCSYNYQLKLKSSIISDIFENKIKLESSEQFAYRNKAVLPVGRTNGIVQIGAYRKNSHDIADWRSDCLVITPDMNEIIRQFRYILQKNDLEGITEHIYIRGGLKGYQAGLIIKKENYIASEMLKELSQENLNITSTFYSISSATNSVLIKNPVFVTGDNFCLLETLNCTYKVPPQSFFQANLFTLDKILQKIRSALTLVPDSKILDLYSGCGVLSDFPGIKRTLIESNPASFDHLESLDDTELIAAEVSAVNETVMKGNYDIIIADPPRKGIDKNTLSAIDNSGAETVIYLSCEPKTQKRDIDLLKNFSVSEIIGYDMFPNTVQIESLAILTRK